MKPVLRTNWNLTPRAAVRLQERLRERVELADRLGRVRCVAGADLAFDPATNLAFAGVIVFRFPGLEEVERQSAERPLRFPYVPGLLSFRESPVLLAAFRKLRTEPDVILVDGHGIAHPRRFGIACHLGLLLDKPTIGCAKSLLVGEHPEPARRAGSTAPLTLAGERVGAVLRTRDGVKPIFVTQGHRVSLETAVELVKGCLDGTRIPKPTREADHYVGRLRRKFQESALASAGVLRRPQAQSGISPLPSRFARGQGRNEIL
ncbi:MAG TPA: deoxyribonuclease V [Terriglobia bacterium]|nr:deoxyribonuclease V [Terriglobia bacterium]